MYLTFEFAQMRSFCEDEAKFKCLDGLQSYEKRWHSDVYKPGCASIDKVKNSTMIKVWLELIGL